MRHLPSKQVQTRLCLYSVQEIRFNLGKILPGKVSKLMFNSKHLFIMPLLASLCLLQGCVVATAIDIASETVQAGVGVTGAVIGAGVDIVTDDDDDDKKSDKK